MGKRALITGITGQDGAYLSRLLLDLGYEVMGLMRSVPTPMPESLSDISQQIKFIEGDFHDVSNLRLVLLKVQPNEIYNLGAQSVVTKSWDEPLNTIEVTGMGPIRLLEAIRLECPSAKFFQASSSEMIGIGDSLNDPLDAEFYPLSPYAASKLLGYHMCRLYRERYGLFVVSAVLFNHESPFRPPNFVTRKISIAAAQASQGKLKTLPMGDLDVIRDWGFAGDYVRAMWQIMQQGKPKDYVVATGLPHSVRDIATLAFESVGLDYRDYVISDPSFLRPLEAKSVIGDPARIKKDLGWVPKVSFEELIPMMVQFDIRRLDKA